MMLEKDQTLVGIVKSTVFTDFKHTIPVQKFMKISYFFNWISHITGMELPECEEQAPSIVDEEQLRFFDD